MKTFKESVLEYIIRVPRGKVVSYGQVAAACLSPKAARQVGGILKAIDTSSTLFPWWRVVNNKGLISIKGNWTATKELQRALLLKEGVKVGLDYSIDMNKYRYAN
jgi:methylated-DNA-protein-cysteine methyltransferase related protein